MRIVRHADIQSFSDRVHSWLMRNEPEYNLLLALMERIRRGNHGYGDPLYLVSIEDGGEVVGCAWRTPPFKLGLTRIPIESVPLLAEDIAEVFPSLPGVLGADEEARPFAELWCRLKGNRWSTKMRQRIHALERVDFPARPPGGHLRQPTVDDSTLLASWLQGLAAATQGPVVDFKDMADSLIRNGGLFLWEDAGPRSLVGYAGKTPNGMRIGYVYTPVEFRNSGYASVAVASLCIRAMQEGARFCFLYTDLDNPVSNGVYRKIGFRPVADVLENAFIT